MPRRITLLFLWMFGLWVALILRGVNLQILPNEKLEKRHEKQSKTLINIEGRRGFIYDRKGNELAASVTAYSLYADPKMVQRPRELSRKLSKILKLPQQEIYKKIRGEKRRFVWIQRRMDLEDRNQILKLNDPGLGFIEEPKRVYPNANLLSSVLGFVGSQGQGLGGLEVKFEENLSGSDRNMRVQRDARGRPLFINGVLFNENPDGYNLHLTIDRDLQHRLEKELFEAIEKYNAKSAWGVVLSVEDSQILAMANLPSFDPNHALNSPIDHRRNRSVTDPFEPGSSMKTITVAAALRESIAKPESKYYCEEGRLKIGRRVIREADARHKFKWLTVEEILMLSSNIGTSKIAFELGPEALRRALLDFGFGSKSSSDFPAESRGIVPALPWGKHLLSNISFGHGVAVTPLQLANAYAAIANGGVLHEPYVVSQISDSQGRNIFRNQGKELHRVLEPDVARQVLQMLEKVVSKEGTGDKARLEFYTVGGKTGTAQKTDLEKGGYEKGAYISSFVGVLPVEAPKFAILIAVDQPEKAYYASEVAAPVFAKVANFAAFHYGLKPSPSKLDLKKMAKNSKGKLPSKNFDKSTQKAIQKIQSLEDTKKWDKMPNLKGISLREAMDRMRQQGYEPSIYGSGTLSYSVPDQGQNIDPNTKVKLYFK